MSSSANVSSAILEGLTNNIEYTRKTIPFLKEEYFSSDVEKTIFNIQKEFFDKHNQCITLEALYVELNSRAIIESLHKSCVGLVSDFSTTPQNVDWLVETAERFCKDRAVYNAIMQSIGIIDGNEKKFKPDAIPSILQDALAVSFDTAIGHDYFGDAEVRYDSYHDVEEKIPFDIDILNKITNGGVTRKSLSVFIGGSGSGKSLFMCHHASHCLRSGYNVLYITLEMAEKKIAERIDANLFDVNINDIKTISKGSYLGRVGKIKDKTQGTLVIKEYPTASAHAGHFRSLIEELKMKKNFTADIIFVDYLNICSSQKVNAMNNNSYTIVKSIAEELRALSMHYNVPVITASQLNREGSGSTDVSMSNISESMGTAFTVDLMIALIVTDELNKMGQMFFKQLKNRYGDLSTYTRFMVGVDKAKMKFYNLEDSAQEDIANENSYSQTHTKPTLKNKFAEFK